MDGISLLGTRANLQKDPEKRRIAKFRMALRFSWASSLHAMSPKDMVDQGLRDPAIAFVKGEGHPPRKVESETWRLIWNLSEVDRLLDAAVFTDQDKADIQSEPPLVGLVEHCRPKGRVLHPAWRPLARPCAGARRRRASPRRHPRRSPAIRA